MASQLWRDKSQVIERETAQTTS